MGRLIDEFCLLIDSRTHIGCDEAANKKYFDAAISIHAPIQDATRLWLWLRIAVQFQFTHSHGVRQEKIDLPVSNVLFQFTHSCRVRLRWASVKLKI